MSQDLPSPDDAPTVQSLSPRWAPKHLPAEVVALYEADRHPEERLIGAREVDPVSPRKKGGRAFLLLSTHRALLIEETGQQLPHLSELDPAQLDITPSRLTRDVLTRAGEPLLLMPNKVLDKHSRELVELALLPPVARALAASKLLVTREEDHHGAASLLSLTSQLPKPEDATSPEREALILDLEDPQIEARSRVALARHAPLTLEEQILAWRARTAIAIGAQGAAISTLAELTAMRPEDDLIASTAHIGEHDVRWWLPIALAHEEAGDMHSAASVYALLFAQHPAHPLFLLSRARCLRQAHELDEATQAYERYLALASEALVPFDLTRPSLSATPDPLDDVPRDPHADLLAATLELGELHQTRARWPEAFDCALRAIHVSPLDLEAYRRLDTLAPHLKHDREAQSLRLIALELLQILSPAHAAALHHDTKIHNEDEQLSPGARPIPPTFSHPLSQQAHEEVIVHPGERSRASSTQRWVSSLLIDKESTRDIERHCQLLAPSTHDEAVQILSKLSEFLGIQTPRCYLSHGMTGVQVHGERAHPFLLLGAAHLEAGHPQHLSSRQLTFAFATQLEHVRADHLLLTSSEFWGAFRDRALSGGIALLSLIPVGGALGKITDGLAGPILDKLKQGLDSKLLKALMEYLEGQVKGGAAHGHLQGAYERTLGALLASERVARSTPRDQESLIKEQLADFARSAMHTADRLGLLACDDVHEATRAIFLLSSSHHIELASVERDGLAALLSRQSSAGEALYGELALRFGELFAFALSRPFAALRLETLATEDKKPIGP